MALALDLAILASASDALAARFSIKRMLLLGDIGIHRFAGLGGNVIGVVARIGQGLLV